MAEGEVGGEDNVILKAVRKYKPTDRRLGLSFEKDCIFVLLNRHEINPRNRRKLFFVYDVAGKYGFVPKKEVKNRRESPPSRDMGIVVEDYEPVEPQEMRLRVGDIVEITDKAPTGWFNGICGGRQGWFPRDFMKDDFDTFVGGGVELTYQFTVQALTSNIAESPGHLSFSAWDFLDIVKRPNTTDPYWIGRTRNGMIGRLPKDRLDERTDMPSVLSHWPWYHGDCNREQATTLIGNRLNTPNYFLIRHASKPGDFAVTVTCGQNGAPLNIRIRTFITGYEVDGRNFTSLEEIVNYYSVHPIHIENDAAGRQVFLHHPVYRSDNKAAP